jgi:phosphinothricin acetyltransferase
MPDVSDRSAPDIRRATRSDLPAITEIYNHYVETTPITFDVKRYSVQDREPWFAQFADRGRHQLFVAERAGRVVGYAGSMPFRPKAAYETTIEVTIYLEPDEQSRGLGPRMYEKLFAALQSEDVHRALAGVTLPNEASVRMHARFGFALAGTFREVGRKFGRYWDVAWYEKQLPG